MLSCCHATTSPDCNFCAAYVMMRGEDLGCSKRGCVLSLRPLRHTESTRAVDMDEERGASKGRGGGVCGVNACALPTLSLPSVGMPAGPSQGRNASLFFPAPPGLCGGNLRESYEALT